MAKALQGQPNFEKSVATVQQQQNFFEEMKHCPILTKLFFYMCMQNGSHLWPLALQKRKEGRCPLEPGEIAVILRALGYTSGTQIYVASGQVYGGKNRMAPLMNMFPNLVRTDPHLSTNTFSGAIHRNKHGKQPKHSLNSVLPSSHRAK